MQIQLCQNIGLHIYPNLLKNITINYSHSIVAGGLDEIS